MAGLADLFDGTPRIWALLKADLVSMGHDLVQTPADNAIRWNEFFIFSEMFRKGGLLTWLNRDGAVLLVRDEMNEDYHCSSYAEASLAV